MRRGNINIYQSNRFAKSDTCRHCGSPMSGENLSVDQRGVRHCKNCWRAAAQRTKERKLAGLPPMRHRVSYLAPPKPAPKPVAIDHMQCDPRNVESLCDECRAIYRDALRATA